MNGHDIFFWEATHRRGFLHVIRFRYMVDMYCQFILTGIVLFKIQLVETSPNLPFTDDLKLLLSLVYA